MANHERGRGDQDRGRDREGDPGQRQDSGRFGGDRFADDRNSQNSGGGEWRRGYGAEGPARDWNRNVAFGHGAEDRDGENRDRNRGFDSGHAYGPGENNRFAGESRSGAGNRNDRRDQSRGRREDFDRDDYGPDYLRDYAPVDRDRGESRFGAVGPRGFGSSAGYPGRERSSDAYPENNHAYTRPPEGRDRDEHRSGRDVWSRASEAVSSVFGEPGGDRWRGDPDEGHGHRGRGPKGYARSDERIREDINERLAYDSWVDASGIEVTVAGGDVTLSGSVDGRDARRRAEGIAERVSGVAHVNNNLRVNRNTDHPTGPDKSWRIV